MNIQGMSRNAPAQGASQQGDPRLKSLEQEISNLQKRIQEVRKNEKLDPKIKEEKIKEYEKQIQTLQQEKAKIQAEERQNKRKMDENEETSASQSVKTENEAVGKHVQNAFTQMESFKKSEKAIGVVREQIKGELRIAESNSFLRKPDPVTAAKARGKIANMDNTMMGKATEITEELNIAAKESATAPKDNPDEEEYGREHAKKGTGRMEPGQFFDDEA